MTTNDDARATSQSRRSRREDYWRHAAEPRLAGGAVLLAELHKVAELGFPSLGASAGHLRVEAATQRARLGAAIAALPAHGGHSEELAPAAVHLG